MTSISYNINELCKNVLNKWYELKYSINSRLELPVSTHEQDTEKANTNSHKIVATY